MARYHADETQDYPVAGELDDHALTNTFFTTDEIYALCRAIYAGDPDASSDAIDAITQWALAVQWHQRILTAALAGRCGLRQGADGVEMVGLTSAELLGHEV